MEEQRQEEMKWIDSLNKAHRAFLNEYSVTEYQAWRKSRLPMAEFEKKLRISMNLSATSPVADAHRMYLQWL